MSQTYQPNRRKRAKTHGFLVRAKTPGGQGGMSANFGTVIVATGV